MNNTTKLYWEKPYDTYFSAKVTDVWQDKGRLFAVLDSTLFYPEGGGQPSDQGAIVITPDSAPPDFDAPEFGLLAPVFNGGTLSDTGGLCDGVIYNVGHVFEDDGRIVHVLSLGQKLPPETIGIIGPTTLGETDEAVSRQPIPDAKGTGKRPSEGHSNPLKNGQVVYGMIDWGRRFDFMQQHTGQHILSRAFEEICSANTVGFHLGDDYVSIDLDVSSVEGTKITAVEDIANEIIFKNLPVEVCEYEQGQVPDSIRMRIPTESGPVRIIYVGDFDACACGGTHVQSTGEVGIIKINQLDRSHGGVRVIFRCGKRALLDLREKEKVLDDIARALSVGYKDLPAAVASLSEKAVDLDKQAGSLKKQLLEYETESLAREIESIGTDERPEGLVMPGPGFAVCQCEGKQPGELRFMAKSISELTGKMVVVLSLNPRFSLVVASPMPENTQAGPRGGSKAKGSGKRQRFSHVPPARNASLLVSKLAKKWGLGGGGTPHLAQMGSKEPLSKSREDILKDITDIIENLGELQPDGRQ